MTAARGISGGTIYQRGARTKSRYYHYYHLISRCIIVLLSFCVLFSPVRSVNLIPGTVCTSRWCRQILSRLRADLREKTPPNNGHHVMCSSNQREAFLIAPATTATPISPWDRYWKCTFSGKYAFSTPSIVTAILQVMLRQVVIIFLIRLINSWSEFMPPFVNDITVHSVWLRLVYKKNISMNSDFRPSHIYIRIIFQLVRSYNLPPILKIWTCSNISINYILLI